MNTHHSHPHVKILLLLFLLLLLLLANTLANAAAVLDTRGMGFIHRSSVQRVLHWNSATFQENAGNLQFRFSSESNMLWRCQGITPIGETVVMNYAGSGELLAPMVFEERHNRRAQVFGYYFGGFMVDSAAGACPVESGKWQQQPYLIGEISITGRRSRPHIEVSDDGIHWYAIRVFIRCNHRSDDYCLRGQYVENLVEP